MPHKGSPSSQDTTWIPMNWDDLKIFLALSRQGSARAAADKLGMHHSTITRRIEALESGQKMHLFDRSPTGYSLTSTGEDLLQAVSRIESEVMGIERNMLGRETDLKGEIRVTMPDVIAANLLMPDLVRFMERYPDIQLKVLVSYNLFSLTKREADVAIRISGSPPEHLVGRKVVHYHIANYASRDYLAKYPLPIKN